MSDEVPAIARTELQGQAVAPSLTADSRGSAHSSVAPAWHTIGVLLIMLGVSWIGGRINSSPLFATHGRTPTYLITMAIEWATVAFIWWGLSLRGNKLSELIGGRWERGAQVLRDLGIGIGFFIVFGTLVQGLTSLFKAAPTQALSALMPHTPLEMILWVLVSATGGICEEVIFRGYLQRQFSALTHAILGGIVLQAVIFGLSHGYQGWKMMAIIVIYGCCFGWLAQWRRSLRPGIIAHAVNDAVGGLVAYFHIG